MKRIASIIFSPMKFRFAIREEDGRRVEGRHAIVNCDILRRSRSQLRGKYFREMLRARQFSNVRLEKRREKEEKSLSKRFDSSLSFEEAFIYAITQFHGA